MRQSCHFYDGWFGRVGLPTTPFPDVSLVLPRQGRTAATAHHVIVVLLGDSCLDGQPVVIVVGVGITRRR